jgi:hypothetical protein
MISIVFASFNKSQVNYIFTLSQYVVLKRKLGYFNGKEIISVRLLSIIKGFYKECLLFPPIKITKNEGYLG